MDLGKLDEVANRIDSLRRLRRKYGEDEAQILEFLEQARSEVTILEDSEASEEELQTQLASSQNILLDRCKRLSEIRKSRADQFAKIVESELRDLAMERAVFGISIVDQEPTETGADLVEFLFSANAGEPPRPLAKIASGGEVSRVMLALKTALAGKAGVPTLIFDEVDSGLGGRAAATMGRKLEQLGEHYQVLVISHSPQIASRARDHLRIEKVEMNGRVVTQVRRLNDDERIDEIARMLAGEAITPSSIANARDLLGLTAL
jgi:DNA repair protein RecN (Recombination protein N)